MELANKLESALVNYLKSDQIEWPEWFDFESFIFPGESDEEKAEQCIVCAADDSDEEMPIGSGNFFHPVNIEVRTPANLLTPSEESSGEVSAKDKHDALAAVVYAAMNWDNLPALLTAEEDDFTCFGVIDRRPTRQQEEDIFSSGITFRALCCPSSFA